MLALHRTRERLVAFRTMRINGLRGLLTDYGEVMGKGRAAITKAIPEVLARVADRLPAVLIDTLREQWSRVAELDGQIARIERRMREWKKDDRAVKAISEIPGVELLTATAAVAMIGDVKAFRSGREFAAWVGLVPKQTGSGGKANLHGISKLGDTYLRTLLTHGARSVLTNAKGARPVDRATEEAATVERGDRRVGEQDGANDLGSTGSRSTIPERIRERETGMTGQHGTEGNV